MNVIDLAALLVLLFAVWRGWRQGCILQICALAGFLVVLWIASRFGAAAGSLLRLDAAISEPVGFVVVLLVGLIGVALLGRSIRKIVRFAGMGGIDIAAGIVLAVVKYLLILSLIFTAFTRMNKQFGLVREQTLESSVCFKPICGVAEHLFPFMEWIKQEINTEDEHDDA